MSRVERGINVVATVVITIGIATLGWRMLGAAQRAEAGAEVTASAGIVSLANTATLGQSTAPVVMVEFSDFSCAFCRRFATQTFPRLREKYIETGVLKAAFRHLPLQAGGPSAYAAGVAECARQMGRFWEVHERLFAIRDLAQFDLVSAARIVGVRTDVFEACVSDSVEAVRGDTEEARRLEVQATPTFLFGVEVDGNVRVTDVVNGAQPLAEFERIIERLRRRGF